MVNSQFGSILKDFESFFNCTLTPDANDSCLIKMGIGITLQIELDRSGALLVGCRLGSLLMGRYRDNMVQAALKSNDSSLPSSGILGFSKKSSQLILFIKLSTETLSNNKISTLMPPFVAKAKQWAEALAKGEVPPAVKSFENKNSVSGLFGLISK